MTIAKEVHYAIANGRYGCTHDGRWNIRIFLDTSDELVVANIGIVYLDRIVINGGRSRIATFDDLVNQFGHNIYN